MTMARTIPGQSITQRLMRRVASRPHIGAQPSFFERLGVADPLAIESDVVEDSKKEMFSFLSAAGYYRDLRASRFGFMSRIGGRHRKMAGERLRSVGPRAAMVRPSLLASLATEELTETFLETPEAVEEAPERVIYRDRKARPTMRRVRRAARPVERVMAQEIPEADDETPIVRAIAELVRSFSGRARREVSTLVERIRVLPKNRQVEAARREMRQLRGLAAASTQVVVDEIVEETSQSPVHVAQARLPAPGRLQKGLRRVLGESPALLTLEAPEEVVEPAAVSRRTVRGPEFGRVRRASARREAPVSAAREQARTQQTSGRAGPVPAIAPIAAARTQQTRRPTEWMASLAVAADRPVATSEVSYGLAAAGAKPIVDRGTSRIVVRAEAGDIEPTAGISSSATGWMKRAVKTRPRRQRRIAPEGLLATPDERADSASEVAAPPAASRAPASRAPARRAPASLAPASPGPASDRAPVQQRTPSARSTVRALRRSRRAPQTQLSASPVPNTKTITRGPVGVATPSRIRMSVREGVASTPSSRRRTPTLRAAARSAVSRRSLTASPVQTSLRAAEAGPPDSTTSGSFAPRPASRRPASRRPASPRPASPRTESATEQLVDPLRARIAARADAIPAPTGRRRPTPPELQLAVPAADAERTEVRAEPGATLATESTPRRRVASIEETPRAGMTVRAAARPERIVRRSRSGAMLSPVALGHVSSESEAVEAAIEGRRPGSPVTRRPAATNVDAELDTRAPARSGLVLRPSQTATERAARRADEPSIAPKTRRGILAPVPTSYLEPQSRDEEEETVQVSVARSRRDRPTVRAVARAVESTRLDDSGHALLGPAPTKYIGVARDSGMEAVAASPVQRAERVLGTRRATATPPVSQTLIDQIVPDAPVEAGQPGPAPTKHTGVARDRGPEAVAASPAQRAERVLGTRRATTTPPVPQTLIDVSEPNALVAAPQRVPATARLRARSRSTSPRLTQPHRRWIQAPGRPTRAVPADARSGQKIAAAPTARAAARRAPQAWSPRRSTLSRAVNRSDLQYLVAEEIRELADVSRTAPAPLPLRTILKRVAPVVQASGRIGRSIVTVDAARRAVGDARGRRPTVFAHLEESPEGQIVRGRARRASVAGRRPRSAPETVVLAAADFVASDAALDTAAPVEWSEGRAAPRRQVGSVSRPSRLPAVRAAERVEGPRRLLGRRPRPSRTVRAAGGRFTPQTRRTPTAAEGTLVAPTPVAAVEDVASAPTRRRQIRPLDRTFGYLDQPQTSPGIARASESRARRRGRPAPVGDQQLLEPGFDAPQTTEAQTPQWARRAVEGTPVAAAPEVRPRKGARVGGSLLTALARATNPEDVVQVILERSTSGISSELPGPAAQLVRRIARGADAVGEAQTLQPRRQREARLTERGGTARSARSVRTSVLQPRRSRSVGSAPAQSTVRSGQGVGASNVMKLANKLMKLIHLAESQRKTEARSQVRMAEDTAQARAEGGLGASTSKTNESETMNIQTLQQEVLESVLSAIELLQQRREGDPDGRNEWW